MDIYINWVIEQPTGLFISTHFAYAELYTGTEEKVCMQIVFAFDDLCGQKENITHKQHLCAQIKNLSLLSFKFFN